MRKGHESRGYVAFSNLLPLIIFLPSCLLGLLNSKPSFTCPPSMASSPTNLYSSSPSSNCSSPLIIPLLRNPRPGRRMGHPVGPGSDDHAPAAFKDGPGTATEGSEAGWPMAQQLTGIFLGGRAPPGPAQKASAGVATGDGPPTVKSAGIQEKENEGRRRGQRPPQRGWGERGTAKRGR